MSSFFECIEVLSSNTRVPGENEMIAHFICGSGRITASIMLITAFWDVAYSPVEVY
jgi:hypothetical protein